MNKLVAAVQTAKDIEKIVAKLDPSSKDIPLFFQSLDIADKGNILEEYQATVEE